MYKSLITASAMALCAAAVSPIAAQEAPGKVTDGQTEAPIMQEPSEPVFKEPVPSESDAPPAAEAETNADAMTSETETNEPSTAQVEQFVAAGFPTYDADSSGELNPDEFATWLLALRQQQADAPELDAQQASEWAGKAFAQADTDKSQQVSPGELAIFLMG